MNGSYDCTLWRWPLKIDIAGRHVAVTEGLKEHAIARFERLEKYFENIVRVQITMSLDGSHHTVEAVVHASKDTTLIAEVNAADMYAALDLAAAKVGRQLKKHKERLRRRRVGSDRD